MSVSGLVNGTYTYDIAGSSLTSNSLTLTPGGPSAHPSNVLDFVANPSTSATPYSVSFPATPGLVGQELVIASRSAGPVTHLDMDWGASGTGASVSSIAAGTNMVVDQPTGNVTVSLSNHPNVKSLTVSDNAAFSTPQFQVFNGISGVEVYTNVANQVTIKGATTAPLSQLVVKGSDAVLPNASGYAAILQGGQPGGGIGSVTGGVNILSTTTGAGEGGPVVLTSAAAVGTPQKSATLTLLASPGALGHGTMTMRNNSSKSPSWIGQQWNRVYLTGSPTSYTCQSTDQIIGVHTIDTYQINLVDASSVVAGHVVMIKDESGQANANIITITPFGSQTIDGVAGNTTISTSYGSLTLYSNGANWNLCDVDSAGVAGATPGFTQINDTTTSEPQLVYNTANYPGLTLGSNFLAGFRSTEQVGTGCFMINNATDSSTGSFRAGAVTGTQWQRANRGLFSAVVGGINGLASGDNAVVLGGESNSVSAAALGSSIIGGGGPGTTANTVSGVCSSVIACTGITVSGTNTVALGLDAGNPAIPETLSADGQTYVDNLTVFETCSMLGGVIVGTLLLDVGAGGNFYLPDSAYCVVVVGSSGSAAGIYLAGGATPPNGTQRLIKNFSTASTLTLLTSPFQVPSVIAPPGASPSGVVTSWIWDSNATHLVTWVSTGLSIPTWFVGP